MSVLRRFYRILKCNLFQINWGTSVAFIYYFSLIHSLVTHKKPPEIISDLRNTQEYKFWNHKIPARKNLELTNHPQEEILDP